MSQSSLTRGEQEELDAQKVGYVKKSKQILSSVRQ